MNNIVEFFLKSARAYPNHAAIFMNDKVIRYHELLLKVMHLATWLAMQPAKHCAFLSARGFESYTSLLATLMAGKVCVPLTVKNPPERNRHMLNFAEIEILLIDENCRSEHLEILKQCPRKLTVVVFDDNILNDEILSQPHTFISVSELNHREFIKTPIASKNAYLLFTSGSTGTPKAVMTTHESIISYIDYMKNYYQPTVNDRFTQITDLTFDAAFHELFLAWSGGSCLYPTNDNQLLTLCDFAEKHELTFWISVPAVISLLKQWGRLIPNKLSTLRYSKFLGEPLAENLVQAWHECAPSTMIDNLYGPTEATITFTVYRWQKNRVHDSGYVPIGLPINNQKVVILDQDFQCVADGEVGEIYLGGSQVSEGYWNNAEFSAQRYIKLDHLDPAIKYWYRTGDLGYWQSPYGLVFKSRDVDIIKVRGGRVEKLEVELLLKKIAATDLVAVVPWPYQNGIALGLIAFVSQSDKSSHEILAGCRQCLPDYMVPTQIVAMSTLPTNKNGKVDYPHLIQQLVA